MPEMRAWGTDAQVTLWNAAEHAGKDAHALERLPIRFQRRLEAGAACDVRKALTRHRPPRRALERLAVLQNRGVRPRKPAR